MMYVFYSVLEIILFPFFFHKPKENNYLKFFLTWQYCWVDFPNSRLSLDYVIFLIHLSLFRSLKLFFHFSYNMGVLFSYLTSSLFSWWKTISSSLNLSRQLWRYLIDRITRIFQHSIKLFLNKTLIQYAHCKSIVY